MVAWQRWDIIVLTVLLALPLLVVVGSGQLWHPRRAPAEAGSSMEEPILKRSNNGEASPEEVRGAACDNGDNAAKEDDIESPTPQDLLSPAYHKTHAHLDDTIRSAVVRLDFWIFTLIATICVGANVMTLNVMTTLVKDRSGTTWSLQDADKVGNVAVIVVMACSSLARWGVGSLMYMVPSVTKSAYLYGAVAITIASQLVLCVDIAILIFPGCVLLGLSDGCVWTSLPWLTGKVFGLKHMGSIFGTIVCIGASGTIGLSYVLEPLVYNAHITVGTECYGIDCFRITHIICAALNVLLMPCVYLLRQRLQAQFGDIV